MNIGKRMFIKKWYIGIDGYPYAFSIPGIIFLLIIIVGVLVSY